MVSIEKYSSGYEVEWNSFIENSRLDTFLFNRGFMDYHSYKFLDSSFLFFKKNKLIAVLPGNINDVVFYSHQGLSFGGLVLSKKCSIIDVLNIFEQLVIFLKSVGISKIIYKPSPIIYHSQPMQEDLYVIFKLNAKKIACNISSTIFPGDKISFTESRKSGIRKAIKNNVKIIESNQFDAFWEILNNNLQENYKVQPVHSLNDIFLLKKRFDSSIILYLCYLEGQVIVGTVLFVSNGVVHVQYISANDIGKELGALDILFHELINVKYKDNYIFDFGHSNEDGGNKLNFGLIFQKEGFGGRGLVNEIYEIAI